MQGHITHTQIKEDFHTEQGLSHTHNITDCLVYSVHKSLANGCITHGIACTCIIHDTICYQHVIVGTRTLNDFQSI